MEKTKGKREKTKEGRTNKENSKNYDMRKLLENKRYAKMGARTEKKTNNEKNKN